MEVSEELKRLLQLSRDKLARPLESHDFGTKNYEAERLLNDLDNHSHLFVLACLMDLQIRADRAWIIPYRIGLEIGAFDFNTFYQQEQQTYHELFTSLKLHRFNPKMAVRFYKAIKLIKDKYNGQASLIWLDPARPASATVVKRFLEFDGAGIKIATMAANILAMTFKIEMADHSSIDISPDVQVRKFLLHHKLIRPDASVHEIIYTARELSPEYPGLIDELAWEWGRASEAQRDFSKNSRPRSNGS